MSRSYGNTTVCQKVNKRTLLFKMQCNAINKKKLRLSSSSRFCLQDLENGFDPESITLIQVVKDSPLMKLCTVCVGASMSYGLRQFVTAVKRCKIE